MFVLALAAVGWAVFGRTGVEKADGATRKIYVALEGSGEIAVLDAETGRVRTKILLAERGTGAAVKSMPHNVQVSPDGLSVWVTANAPSDEHRHDGHGHAEGTMAGDAKPMDELIVIDPVADRVTKRIPLGEGLHLSHVVVSPDGKMAYALSQEKGLLFEVDAARGSVARRIELGGRSEPHGLRISPDGTRLYIALLAGRGLAIVDLPTGGIERVDLPSRAVQAAVTPDGAYAAVTLYDTKQVALYRVAEKGLRLVDLPGSARGPVQLYPTPDSKYLYVADQGFYFDQPTSEWVYKVDVEQGKVVKEIRAGSAPHGVVVSPDGTAAYVTNLVSGDLSVVDLRTDIETMRIPIGETPNGVSFWRAHPRQD